MNSPGLRIPARVDCETRKGGQVASVEARYFASSSDPGRVAVREVLERIRGHRGVEDSPHHIKDRWRDEDRHDTKRPGKGGGTMVALRDAAIGIPHPIPRFDPDEPIRARADRLNRDPDLAIELFTPAF